MRKKTSRMSRGWGKGGQKVAVGPYWVFQMLLSKSKTLAQSLSIFLQTTIVRRSFFLFRKLLPFVWCHPRNYKLSFGRSLMLFHSMQRFLFTLQASSSLVDVERVPPLGKKIKFLHEKLSFHLYMSQCLFLFI